MSVDILFLGPSSDLTGTERASLPLSTPATVGSLKALLASAYPRLSGGLVAMRIAVNQSFATDETPVSKGDEVAVIPPVSGG